jgi:hypothetical protein
MFAMEVTGCYCYGKSMAAMKALVSIEVNGCYVRQALAMESQWLL